MLREFHECPLTHFRSSAGPGPWSRLGRLSPWRRMRWSNGIGDLMRFNVAEAPELGPCRLARKPGSRGQSVFRRPVTLGWRLTGSASNREGREISQTRAQAAPKRAKVLGRAGSGWFGEGRRWCCSFGRKEDAGIPRGAHRGQCDRRFMEDLGTGSVTLSHENWNHQRSCCSRSAHRP